MFHFLSHLFRSRGECVGKILANSVISRKADSGCEDEDGFMGRGEAATVRSSASLCGVCFCQENLRAPGCNRVVFIIAERVFAKSCSLRNEIFVISEGQEEPRSLVWRREVGLGKD